MAGWVQELGDFELPPVVLQMLLSAVAALISMVLFTPTMRFVRSYWLHSNTPEWAADYIGCGGTLATLRMHLHLLLPMALPLLWVSGRTVGRAQAERGPGVCLPRPLDVSGALRRDPCAARPHMRSF